MKSVAAPRTGCEIISERHTVVVVQAHVCHTSQCSRQHLWQLQREINVFKALMEVSVVNKSKTVSFFSYETFHVLSLLGMRKTPLEIHNIVVQFYWGIRSHVGLAIFLFFFSSTWRQPCAPRSCRLRLL